MSPTTTASTATLSPDMRRVLDAPRGQRFSRPSLPRGTRPRPRPAPGPPPLVSLGRTPRERELLAQMPDTPRLRHRFAHGDLPAWMVAAKARKPQPPGGPRPERRPTSEPGDGPRPVSPPIPRPRRERTPPPPLPRRSDRPRRPASHRKPRGHRLGWVLTGHALAVTAGALAQHLTGLLG